MDEMDPYNFYFFVIKFKIKCQSWKPAGARRLGQAGPIEWTHTSLFSQTFTWLIAYTFLWKSK